MRTYIKKLDAHFADGRAHVAGDKITWADFAILSFYTSIYSNPNAKHADIREATAAMLAECTNFTRVVAPMRELCAAQIAALPPSPL